MSSHPCDRQDLFYVPKNKFRNKEALIAGVRNCEKLKYFPCFPVLRKDGKTTYLVTLTSTIELSYPNNECIISYVMESYLLRDFRFFFVT